MKVVLTAAAARDLENISDYIAQDSKSRARSFARELRRATAEVGRTPEAFPLVQGYEDRGFRRRVHGAYLIFYRLEPDHALILRVLHGARDYPELLG